MNQLREKAFRAWPQNVTAELQPIDVDMKYAPLGKAHQLTTQPHVHIPLFIQGPQNPGTPIPPDSLLMELPDNSLAILFPRGAGIARWEGDDEQQNKIARRFYLLGQSIEGMQVYDVRQAIAALRAQGHEHVRITASGRLAGVALYASLFEPGVAELHLHALPSSHRDGPTFLNVQRFIDMPHALALAAERTRVVVYDNEPEFWQPVVAVRDKLGWPMNHFEIRALHTHHESSATERRAP